MKKNNLILKWHRQFPLHLRIFGAFLIIFVAYYALQWTRVLAGDNGWTIRSLTAISIFSILLYQFYLVYKKKWTYEKAIYAILLLGLCLRIGYAASTSITLRQHDLGALNESGNGHYAYILTIYNNWTLPATNNYQFYHPPLFHFLSAVWMHINGLWFKDADHQLLMGTVRILTIFYSYATLLISYHIIKRFLLSKKSTLIMLLLLAVYPIFILLSGRINNDGLATMWLFLSILYLLKIIEKFSLVNIFILALSIGLGMASKMSVAIIAPIGAIILIIVFIKKIKQRQIWLAILGLSLFAIIVFPIGLWYPIRNLIEFDQSLVYVWEITNMNLSTADYSLWQRFGFAPFSHFTESLFARPGADYNIYYYLLKTSMFGEFSYWGSIGLAVTLLVGNAVLMIIALITVIAPIIYRFKKMTIIDLLMYGLLILSLGAYVQFNLAMPYGPTMDFRYLIVTILIGSYFIFKSIDDLHKNKKTRVLSSIITSFIVVFASLTSLFAIFLY